MIDMFEIEDLITAIYEKEEGKEPDTEKFDSWDYLVTKYGCDYETFANIVEELLEFTPILKSPITGTLSHCFGVIEDKNTGLFRAIIKKDI